MVLGVFDAYLPYLPRRLRQTVNSSVYSISTYPADPTTLFPSKIPLPFSPGSDP